MRRPGTAGPWFYVAAMVCLAAGAPRAGGQYRPPPFQGRAAHPARILGVFDIQTGLPMDSVEVSDVINGTKSLTTKTGTVSLFFLPEGGTLVRVRKVGYQAQTFMVSTAPQDTLPITIVMERVTELPAIVTRDSSPHYLDARLRGFEERRHIGFGYFIAEAELRKHDAQQLSDVITLHIPATRYIGVSSGVYLAALRGQVATLSSSGPCFVTMYRDGVLLYSMKMAGAGGPPNLRQLDVSDYAGIEYYAGGATIPPQYNATDSGCGVMLLWTREK